MKALVVIVALLWPFAAAAYNDAGDDRHLAILSSEEVQESGLSDLLTVQMQKLAGVELVERDLLRKVLDEVALSLMLGAEQSENRRKAGALLKADVLVLLSLEEAEDQRKVKVVISDCSSGARLRIGWVLFDSRHIQGACRDLMTIVSETLERFGSGIKQIIGVSYFVSRNLVHDYDHLQAGYANLLGNALSSLPGIAVIEIEEARSIRLEDELAGNMRTDRIVPLFVEGEFRVQNPGSKKQGKVHITISLSDSGGLIKQVERKNLPVDQVAEFITNDVAKEILRFSESPLVRKLDKETQFVRLVERASEFARVGAWEESIALGETAVLLKPNSVEQRIKLMEEYSRIKKRVVSIEPSLLIIGEYEQLKWRLPFEHLEYMIYNKLVSMKEATGLSAKCLRLLPRDRFFLTPTPGQPTEAEAFKKDFLRRVYPQVLKLNPSLDDPAIQPKEYQRWYKCFLHHVFYRCDGGAGDYHDKEDLKLLFYLHDNVVPDVVSPSPTFISFLKKHGQLGWRQRKPARGKLGYFAEQNFLDFITAMSRSKRLLASFYGRYALLYHEYHKRRKQGAAMDGLHKEAELLINEMKKHKFLGRLVRETKDVLKKIEQYIQKEKDKKEEPVGRGETQG